MDTTGRLALALAAVVASMILLFVVPAGYFTAATFGSTSAMMAAAYYWGLRPKGLQPSALLAGVLGAAALYLIFYLGAAAIDVYHPLGVTSASESSIYSLITSRTNPIYVQVGLLLFDSAGYESFFRGVVQAKLTPRLGVGAAPAVALFDAALHVATLNPVWVVGTFVTDLAWGLTYHYGSGVQSSFTSHLIWDLAIFIIRPVT